MKWMPDPRQYPEGRVFALDFLRGADMLVLVAWCAIGQAIGRAYDLGPGWMAQFQHPWIGFTLWDFIQPLFMFVVGAAVPLALAKRLTDEGKAGWNYWKHVLTRIAMLWFLGGIVQCNWLTLDPLKMTPYGNTLQTISVGYFLSALVYPIRRTWVRFAIVLAGVAAYEIPLHLAGDYTMYGNWAVRFDMVIWRAILPEGNVFLDPQGWTRFSTTPIFLFLCACGMESTRLLMRRDLSSWRKAGVLAAVGLAMCLFGLLLWKVVGIPLIKHIFSASFAFLAQGLCLLLFAATYVVTDIWRLRRGTGVVLLWGQCALFAYFMSHVFARSYWEISERCLQGLPRLVPDARLVSVLNAIGSMAVLTFFMIVWRRFRAARCGSRRDERLGVGGNRDAFPGKEGKRTAKAVACIAAAVLSGHLMAAGEQVEVRVRKTTGGPQIQVDGRSVSPRMFWGIDNPRRRPVDGTWRRHRLSFTPRADAATCRFELNPQKASGRLEVRGIDTNALYRAERDRTLTFDFEVRAEGAISYFRPALVQLAPKNEHFEYHRLLSVTPDDPEDSNFISQCRAARRAGVRFFSFFAPNLWPERGGEIEFAVWDKTCDALIAAIPDALIVPRVTINPPDPWLDAHPEVKMVSETGETWNAPSIHSPLYRAAALDYTRRVARHFMERYPRHFAGLHMTGQSTQEWYYWGSWETMSGYDAATRAAYRRWLKAEGLPEADVPSREERHAQDAVRGLIDPSRRPNVIRFNRFLSEAMVDFMGEICRATREATDGRKLVFSFYGYAYELVSFRHGVPASGNCALQRVFEKWADAVDILCAPLCYTDRAWLGTSPAIGPVETVNRNGMFWLNEDDLRTHLVEDNSSGDGGYAPLYAPGETADAMRRTMLQEIVRGAAGWWMDHGTGWYDSWDEIWRPVADLDVLERASLARRRPYTPEVAVLADEESLLCCGTGSHLFARPLLNLSRFAFPRAGVSYGQYMLQDVLAKPLSDEAKLRIHPCTIYLTPEKERRLAAAREAAPKVVRAWCHLPGLLNEKGLDTAGVERLTGFAADLVTTGACVATATALGRHLGLPPSFGVREPIGRLVPRLKDGDEVWATWADGSPAVVVRGNGTGGADALVGTAELPAELIRALALRAGARSLLAADEVNRAAVWRSDDLEVVQSLVEGFRDFRKGEVRVRRVENAACPCGVPGRSPLDAR